MNLLRCIVKNPDSNGILGFEIEIDFIPSQGLIIYEPIHGVIGSVVYDKKGYTANMASTLMPTDTNTEKWLRETGWKEYKI